MNAVRKPLRLVLHFDGSCERNPGGPMRYGWTLGTAGGTLVASGGDELLPFDSLQTCNIAEYGALLHALQWLDKLERPIDSLLIRGDSLIVINGLNKNWRGGKPHLLKLRDKCFDLLKKYDGRWQAEWISRKYNVRADALSRRR